MNTNTLVKWLVIKQLKKLITRTEELLTEQVSKQAAAAFFDGDPPIYDTRVINLRVQLDSLENCHDYIINDLSNEAIKLFYQYHPGDNGGSVVIIADPVSANADTVKEDFKKHFPLTIVD